MSPSPTPTRPRHVPSLLHGLVLVWALLLAPSAHAIQDLITQRGVLADPAGTLTVDEVAQRQDFRTVNGPVSRGYTPTGTWLRLEVPPTRLGELVLLVQPTYLDDLRLFSPRAPDGSTASGWIEQRSGDRVPLSAKTLKTINPAFLVASDPDRPTVHYLRLQSTSVSLIHVKALSRADLATFDVLIHSAVSAYAGLIAILAAFAFVCWRVTRDPIWGLDALFQVATVAFTLSIMGVGGRYWFAEWPVAADLSTSVTAVSHLAMGSLFFWRLFKSYSAPGWTTWLYRGSILLLPIQLGLIASGDPRTAVSVNANLLLLQTVAGLFIIWFVPIQDRVQRWMLRFVFTGLTLYLLFFILPLLGLAQATEFNLYPALGANLFTGLLLQGVLWRRTHLQLKERAALRVQLAKSEQHAKHEAARRAEASSFLGMLVHEIKNPLASIALASNSLAKSLPDGAVSPEGQPVAARQLRHIQNAVQGIDAVLERCVDADRLEQGELMVRPEPHDVAQMLADWLDTEPEAGRVLLVPAQPLLAQVDAPLLCLMVRNLLSNALRYSPEGSRAVLRLERADAAGLVDATTDPSSPKQRSGFRVTVANAVGRAGVPDPERLFQKYYRAPDAQRQTGTGLGLYWVQGVARLLGGEVGHRHEPQSPHPVVFHLWLPLEPQARGA